MRLIQPAGFALPLPCCACLVMRLNAGLCPATHLCCGGLHCTAVGVCLACESVTSVCGHLG